jgi:Xaa-Pro dipeptidase
MSRHDFAPEEFRARRSRFSAMMAQKRLDWAIIIHPVSIRWLTGSDAKSYQEFQCLLAPAGDGPLTVLTREGERAEFLDDALVDAVHGYGGAENEDPLPRFAALADDLGLRKGRVWLEVPPYYLHPLHYMRLKEWLGDALVSESATPLLDLTLVKSPAEIAYIRRASELADAAYGDFRNALAPGISELALAGRVYARLLADGSGLSASPINLVSGERSGFSHGAPTERLLRDGDFGSVEYGATFRRYTATLGRQFVIGRPTARMRELMSVAREAADACLAEIRAGVPAVVPHRAAKRVIERAGLAHGRVHTTGYGLAPGFPPTWGEPIHMLDDSTYTLEEGMVLSVEPPVFLGDERLGARLIDNVIVGKYGAELLSGSPRELIEA